MTDPLVTVMLVSHDAAGSLPLALTSLQAQTYRCWECVLVDDGSTDGTADLLATWPDPRVRVLRHAQRRGRGAARQTALDAATGELLCFLDADDWMYPDRVARQVAVLEADPDVCLVSAGLAILDVTGGLRSVRIPNGTATPPVAFAPAMLRRSAAARVGFDPELESGEDADFLMRLLPGRRWRVIDEPLYAYAEYASFDPAKLLASLRAVRRRERAALRRDPARAIRGVAATSFKLAAYRAAFALGMGARVLDRRNRPPTDAERRAFAHAQRVVAGARAAAAAAP